MALPNDEEKVLLEKFREKVQDCLKHEHQKDDMFLVRWIRAREKNLEAAETMLRNSMKWREENKIDSILDCMPDPYFTKNYPYWMNGVDKKGQPVLCAPMSEWDVRKAVEDGRMEEFTQYSNRMYERLLETIRACDAKRKTDDDNPITQFTLILNWDEYSMMQMSNMKAVQGILQFAQTYEAHYPEILDKAFFINTNKVFQALFALMKPLLAPKTVGKIQIFGTDRKEWEPVVRDHVEEHQIARQFGG